MKRLFLALLVLHLAACSSMQPVDVRGLADTNGPAEVRVGDRVEVTNHSNEKIEFTVTDINAGGVSGQFGFIRYDDIRRMSVERPGSGEVNLTWLWGVLGVAAAVWLISSADSVKVCSPSPCPSDP